MGRHRKGKPDVGRVLSCTYSGCAEVVGTGGSADYGLCREHWKAAQVFLNAPRTPITRTKKKKEA